MKKQSGLIALSIATLGTIFLTRRASAASVQFEYMPELLVDKRGMSSESIHNFIKPSTVAGLNVGAGSPLECYEWVTSNMNYLSDAVEHWQYPMETVNRAGGDCEDTSFLMVSAIKLKNAAHVAAGWFVGSIAVYGHAWVVHNGFIFESTLTVMPLNPWRTEKENAAFYIPMIYWNDVEIYAVPSYINILTARYGTSVLSGDPNKKKEIDDFWSNK